MTVYQISAFKIANACVSVAQQIANALRVDPVAVEAIVSRQTDGRGVTEQEQVAAAMVLEVFMPPLFLETYLCLRHSCITNGSMQVFCLLHKPTCIAVGQAGVVEVSSAWFGVHLTF